MSLASYAGRNVIDLRTWYTTDDGRLKPGKGFCAEAKHLPLLASALVKATAKARELGLIATDNDGADQ